MTLPLWISTDQADRLKAALEKEGFTDVDVRRGPRGGEVVVSAKDNGRPYNANVLNVMGLEAVVGRFLKWREQNG